MLGGKDDNKIHLIVSSPDKDDPYMITLKKRRQIITRTCQTIKNTY